MPNIDSVRTIARGVNKFAILTFFPHYSLSSDDDEKGSVRSGDRSVGLAQHVVQAERRRPLRPSLLLGA